MPEGTVITRPPPRTRRLVGKTPELIKRRKPTLLIFGASGVGKTVFALQAPDVYFVDSEGGATQPEYVERLRASGGLYLGPEDGAASFDFVLDQVRALATNTHDRKTLVVDSITKLFANEIAREAERLADAGRKNEFGADKRPAVGYMRQLMHWLSRIDMNVVLTAGEISEWSNDSRGDRVQTGLTFDCWPRLEYELDLAIQVIKQGNSRYGRVRKSRIAAFQQGEVFDWKFEVFSEKYGADIIKEAPTPINCATPEQLVEINRLLEIVKLEEGTVDKWLAAANISKWDEMPTERAAKAIEYLKNRIAA